MFNKERGINQLKKKKTFNGAGIQTVCDHINHLNLFRLIRTDLTNRNHLQKSHVVVLQEI